MRTVPIERIVGSVGRYRDFDRVFLPRQDRTKQRWQNVDRAHHEGVDLPAIELYRLGDVYFVRDGNHRVSVARERGQAFIDARVIEVEAPAPVTSIEDLLEWVCRQDLVDFLARTGIRRLRPEAAIKLSLPGLYDKLVEHIDAHRWFLGIERGRPVDYEEAVASWYDRVYRPVVDIIRRTGALDDFPGRTETDLYLWVMEHDWYRQERERAPKAQPSEETVRHYASEHSERPVKRIARAVKRRVARRES
jgi:hypothetical protein